MRLSELSDVNVAAREAINACVSGGFIPEGELAVITAGVPLGQPGSTNMVEVLTTGKIMLSGTPLVRKNASGRVCLARTPQAALEKATEGCILVVRQIEEEHRPVMEKVGAVLVESGALVAEGNALALDYNLPCVVGVADLFATLSDDDVVTVDGMRGLVYGGNVKLVV